MEKFIEQAQSLTLMALLFLFPLFFLNTTQEFFITNKFYLLAFGTLILLLASTGKFLARKKINWRKTAFDGALFLFLIAYASSILFSSPNKIQALLNSTTGFGVFLFLTILYFISTQIRTKSSAKTIQPRSNRGQPFSHIAVLSFSAILLSLVTIVFFFQPFANVALPTSLLFLKNSLFTPMGSQLSLALFLAFFLVYLLSKLIFQEEKGNNIATAISLFLIIVALSLSSYNILKPASIISDNQQLTNALPPFSTSWFAAVETLKNPRTAIFGVGVDNFLSIFTLAKTAAYNQSPIWQINFARGRSFILQLWTEAGLLGLISFLLIVVLMIRQLGKKGQNNNKPLQLAAYYLLAVLLLFPPSLPILFLFYFTLASATTSVRGGEDTDFERPMNQNEFGPGQAWDTKQSTTELDLSNLPPVYLGTALLSFVFILALSYLLGRSYAAEYYFKKSLDGLVQNNAKLVYDNQRQAIVLNPYIERFRRNFSQVNLLLANNIAAKEPEQITDQDRLQISQAIQAAISEAKAAVALNPQNGPNWENLATVYRNILNVAQGADVWTISAYQRAIIADPLNPNLRLALGGVYYSLGQYDEAENLFEQAVSLKPDWANFHFNLAWAAYQSQNYQRAASEMQVVLNLVDPETPDYQKSQQDLELFKKLIPEVEATEEGQIEPGELQLPGPPAPFISPKLELPKEASPEAK